MENKTKAQSNPLARYLPILAWLPKYNRNWLRTDLIAGLTVVALLIPEGMAYAQIAGVPPHTAFATIMDNLDLEIKGVRCNMR
jgi:MFS superfamily sulfate permease-like transporter